MTPVKPRMGDADNVHSSKGNFVGCDGAMMKAVARNSDFIVNRANSLGLTCAASRHHDPAQDIMFVGGACSVDRHLRTQGLDWREDEECLIAELNGIFDRYAAAKPRIMVTHDAPSAAIKAVLPRVRLPRMLSRTVQAFDAKFEAHRPDAWIFGHWHRSASAVVDGTRFQCLGELGSCTLSWCSPGGTVRLDGGSEHV